MTGIEQAIRAAGSHTKLAAQVGVHVVNVGMWQRLGYVSSRNSAAVARVTGVPVIALERPGKPRARILAYLTKHGDTTGADLTRALKLPNTTVRQQLANFVRQGVVTKIKILHAAGASSPQHVYRMVEQPMRKTTNGESSS